MQYCVALCELSLRDQRLLEIVVNRSDFGGHRLFAAEHGKAASPDIAIVDSASTASVETYNALRAQHPGVIPLYIIDDGKDKAPRPKDAKYTVPRISMLVRVFHVLSDLLKNEIGRRAVSVATEKSETPPAPQPGAQASNVTAFPDTAANAFRRKAIVVDDSAAVRQQLVVALEKMGFHCETAENADDAMRKLAVQAFDLALLDVVMPGLDGYDLCRSIKHDRTLRSLPVVMLTSRSSPFDRARGALAGCNAYLTKPITWEQLKQTIEKVMFKSNSNDLARLVLPGRA